MITDPCVRYEHVAIGNDHQTVLLDLIYLFIYLNLRYFTVLCLITCLIITFKHGSVKTRSQVYYS